MNKQPEALRLAELLDGDKSAHHEESAAELRRLHEVNQELLEALKDVSSSLVAAHSLLRCGGKQAVASDEMFLQMLKDYKKSIKNAIAAIAKAEGESNEP